MGLGAEYQYPRAPYAVVQLQGEGLRESIDWEVLPLLGISLDALEPVALEDQWMQNIWGLGKKPQHSVIFLVLLSV